MSELARPTVCAAGLLLAAGCASSPPPNRHEAAPPAPVPNAAVADASYDWHGLVLFPFGTLLKSSPVPLHEVLLFRDESQDAAAGDTKDCYTVDAAPPRFLGSGAEEYFLCFRYDRLNRIEASARVTAAAAEQTFARACAGWLKDATPTAGSTSLCEGRSGAIAFSARLSEAAGDTEARVSMTLTPAAQGDPADGAAPAPAPAP
jgi:hypothetical protein